MRRFSIVALLVGFTVISTPAVADERDDALAAIQACRNIAADQVRLACLDAATNLLDSIDAAAARTAPQPAAPAINTEAEAIARERAALAAEREALANERAALARAAEESRTASAAVEAERLETERAALEAERAAIEAKRIELAEKEAEADAKTPRRFSLRTPFSSERLPPETPVTIVKITVNDQRVHKFYTSDGDLLIQSDTTRNLIPPSSLPAEAIVHRTTLGAKWLAFNERPKRRLKVKLPPVR